MATIPKVLTALAVLAFVLAVVANYAGAIVGAGAEGFSRASNNLALLAIAITIVFDRPVLVGR